MYTAQIDKVLEQILSDINRRELTQKYTQLVSVFEAAKQQKDKPDSHNRIKLALAELQKELNDVYPDHWTAQDIEIYTRLDASRHIGAKAKQIAQDIVTETYNRPDIAGSRFLANNNSLDAFSTEITNLRRLLLPLIDKSDGSTAEDLPFLRVIFDGDISIRTLGSLETETKKWISIIRGISRGISETPGDIEISRVEKNSPFSIDLSLSLDLINSFMPILSFGVAVAALLLQRKSDVEKYRKSEMAESNKAAIIKGLEDEIEDLARKKAEEYCNNEEFKTLEGDARNDLQKAYQDIIGHITDGGQVHAINIIEKDTKEETTKIDAGYIEINQLRSHIQEVRLLPDGSSIAPKQDGEEKE